MQPFKRHSGVAAPLLRANVDTDAIIPSREMKRVSKQGLGEGLFANWRYADVAARTPDPEFVLNQAGYAGCSILLAGENFGCGSSREHAVWALAEFGIRAIVAPSFGSIFYQNCSRNGILPVRLEAEAIARLVAATEGDPQQQSVSIDLEAQQVQAPGTPEFGFEIEQGARHLLLEGLDPIADTLQRAAEIDAFAARARAAYPWR